MTLQHIFGSGKRYIIVPLSIVAVLCLAGMALSDPHQEKTDDAYVRADISLISPQVAGVISRVLVADNQPVKAGQLLALIDDREFRATAERAQAEVASAQAQLSDARASLALQQDLIAIAQAKQDAAQANLTFALKEHHRYQQMAQAGAGTLQDSQQADTRVQSQQAALAESRAGLHAAQNQQQVLQARVDNADSALKAAQARASLAQLNLSWTHINAPFAGVIGRRTLRQGAYVTPGDSLLALVPTRQSYIVANFLENQVGAMQPGQAVKVTLDNQPGKTFSGKVDSIAPASGASFSAVAAENATGNFTKISQRIPVKIAFTPDVAAQALIPGVSAVVSVDTASMGVAP